MYSSDLADLIGGLSAFIIIVGLLIGIYLLIVEWKIIEKSGDKGWKCLIPIYGSYVFMKACNSASCFWGLLIVGFADGLLTVLIEAGTAATIISVICSLLMLIIDIIVCKNTAHAFGKSGGFAAGLFFLGPIFQGILAFGDAEHENMISGSSSGNYSSSSSDSYNNY